jgi:hypothetical protein
LWYYVIEKEKPVKLPEYKNERWQVSLFKKKLPDRTVELFYTPFRWSGDYRVVTTCNGEVYEQPYWHKECWIISPLAVAVIVEIDKPIFPDRGPAIDTVKAIKRKVNKLVKTIDTIKLKDLNMNLRRLKRNKCDYLKTLLSDVEALEKELREGVRYGA